MAKGVAVSDTVLSAGTVSSTGTGSSADSASSADSESTGVENVDPETTDAVCRSDGPHPASDLPTKSRVNRSTHRGDIQGLRAVLMAQVLLYHAWTVGSPIGVDSFIMISAYLMTSSFVRRAEGGNMPSVVDRWGTTFKRLLPPLTLIIVVTLGGCFLVLPQTRWQESVTQAFASLTYWENWRLVEVAADYYAGDHAAASPFQHLWSMSMQGQMFLLWPVLMAACVLLARVAHLRIRPTVVVAFGLLTVASLLWLLFWSPADGSVYFDTRARIWEFAFGSAIAAAAPYLDLPHVLKLPFTWVAMAVLIVYCLVPIGTYPGPMAFVPLICVSALLLFGSETTQKSPSRLLATSPLVELGNVSYSVYLIHWPVFVFFLAIVGRERLSVPEGLVLIAVSLGVAFFVTRWVDLPMQRWKWANRRTRNKWIVIAGCLAVGMLPISVAYAKAVANERQEEQQIEQATAVQFPGAQVMFEELDINFTLPPIPGPQTLDRQWAGFPNRCTEDFDEAFAAGKSASCRTYGDVEESKYSILVVGDSHAEQNLIPPLQVLLDQEGWGASAILKGGCSWGLSEEYEDECVAHNRLVWDYVEATNPEVVFLIVTRSAPDSPVETIVPGVEQLVHELTERGATVFGARDNLRSADDLYECSSDRPADGPFGGCLLDRNDYFAEVNPAAVLDQIPGYHPLDMTDIYCTDDLCPTIVGNIFVYLDDNHITKTYSESTSSFFIERVMKVLSEG